MSKMGLHDSFGHLKHKLWPKERSGVKLAVWLPTTKSWESTWFTCVQVACDILLESSTKATTLFQTSSQSKVCLQSYGPQNRESRNFGNFETPTWESREKRSFGYGPHGEVQNILWGEGGDFPQVRAMVSLVSPNCPWFILAPKVL